MFPVIKSEIIEAGGLEFEVDTCGDPRSDQLILLLHGFPEFAYSWHNQMPMLAEMGFKVWAPNQRGYGRSVRPETVDAYDLDHLVADVGYLIDASGCKSITLVGHDWGGAVAWAAAQRRIRAIDRLVVMNCPHPARLAEGLQTWRQLRRSWYMLFFQLPFLPELLLSRCRSLAIDRAMYGQAVHKERFPPSVTHEFKQNLAERKVVRGMINWYRAAARRVRWRGPRLETLAKIQVPTLMIWGEQDHALGLELTEGMSDLVEDLTLRYIEDASHWVQQDAPQRCNAMLKAWLKDEPVPGFAEPARRAS